jgi:uncharacterized membrane protein
MRRITMPELQTQVQSRWKSKAFWILLTGQIIALIELLGGFKAIGVDLGTAGTVVAMVIEIVFSVLNGANNPTNPIGA